MLIPGFSMLGQLFGIGIVVTVLDMVLKKAGREDIGFWIALAGLVLSMFIVIPHVGALFNTVQQIFHIY